MKQAPKDLNLLKTTAKRSTLKSILNDETANIILLIKTTQKMPNNQTSHVSINPHVIGVSFGMLQELFVLLRLSSFVANICLTKVHIYSFLHTFPGYFFTLWYINICLNSKKIVSLSYRCLIIHPFFILRGLHLWAVDKYIFQKIKRKEFFTYWTYVYVLQIQYLVGQ